MSELDHNSAGILEAIRQEREDLQQAKLLLSNCEKMSRHYADCCMPGNPSDGTMEACCESQRSASTIRPLTEGRQGWLRNLMTAMTRLLRH